MSTSDSSRLMDHLSLTLTFESTKNNSKNDIKERIENFFDSVDVFDIKKKCDLCHIDDLKFEVDYSVKCEKCGLFFDLCNKCTSQSLCPIGFGCLKKKKKI